MKKSKTLAILLLFLSITLVSCSDKKENTESYFTKAQLAKESGNELDFRNNILLYMLTYDDSKEKERDEAVVLYTSTDLPSTLNTAFLKSSDCMEGKITLYKSYASMGQISSANEILETKIHGYLPTADYAMLVVNYPTDSNYTVSVLKQWIQSLKEEDKDVFLSLFMKFISNDISEKAAKTALEIAEQLMNDPYYKKSDSQFADLYKSMAVLLDKLYDTYNASRYWKMVKILNPEDPDAQNK